MWPAHSQLLAPKPCCGTSIGTVLIASVRYLQMGTQSPGVSEESAALELVHPLIEQMCFLGPFPKAGLVL